MIVHLWGQMGDMPGFRALADEHGLALLEDAAQAHGARYDGVRAGAAGDIAAFSFFPGKNLGALGDAGGVATRSAQLAERVRKQRDHGRLDKYRHDEIGTNARLDTLQAAVLSVKLARLEEWNVARRAHAAYFDAAFAGVEGIDPIVMAPQAEAVYHQYVVRTHARDEAIAALQARPASPAASTTRSRCTVSPRWRASSSSMPSRALISWPRPSSRCRSSPSSPRPTASGSSAPCVSTPQRP